ncbi:glycosyltransferase family A protein [Arenicella sp. 4NH20-0111]|uniref:glycosyltransferase family 2 protein n=1 Tax=Arenicella sp. 4NH20-0111 TaxID=3127648 RepID=UPI00334008AB
MTNIDQLFMLLIEVDERVLKNRFVQIVFIDKFASLGWQVSTVHALSVECLGRFLMVSNHSKVQLDRHFKDVFRTLANYSEADLSEINVHDLKTFVEGDSLRYSFALSFFKSSRVITDSFWFDLFRDVYFSKDWTISTRRRFLSYLTAYRHLDGSDVNDQETRIISEGIKTQLLDMSDVTLLSQTESEKYGGRKLILDSYSDLLERGVDESIDKNLVLANLYKADSGTWKERMNQYLSVFDVSQIRDIKDGNFLSIRFESTTTEMKDQGLVTIGMPSYNAEETIVASLESLLNQTYNNIEIIVVDDFSEDGTCEIVEEIAKNDSRVRLVRKSMNSGPYVSRNIALHLARGKFFTINDADDLSHPDRIASHLDLLVKHDAFAVESKMLRITDDLKIISDMKGNFLRKNPSSLFFERSKMLAEFGYWHTVRYGADSELFSRIETRSKKIIKSPKPYLFARYSLQNLSVSQNNIFRGTTGNRKFYSESFRNFHRACEDTQSFKYGFVQSNLFSVPIEMIVDRSILENVSKDIGISELLGN